MALQNRVDPWGRLQAVVEKGTLLGNRGVLHNERQEIVRPWKLKAWITCELEFKGRKRQIMQPGLYTELFFLDEATALAAGHRPCAECRRVRYNEFKAAWLAANPDLLAALKPGIGDIDKILHAERTLANGEKRTHEQPLATVPDGTMVELDGAAWLVWRGRLQRWSFAGYGEVREMQGNVQVLTPLSMMKMFAAGFRPQVHESLAL